MSIKAMKQALEAIQDLRGYRPDIDKAIEALRTAIQQAEAKTDEPVAGLLRDMQAIAEGAIKIPAREYAMHALADFGANRNHPAPGVPDGYALVPIKPTAEMMRAWNAATSEAAYLTFTERGYDAMLAASPAQKGGE